MTKIDFPFSGIEPESCEQEDEENIQEIFENDFLSEESVINNLNKGWSTLDKQFEELARGFVPEDPPKELSSPTEGDPVKSAEHHIRVALEYLGLYDKMPEWKQQHIKDTPRRIAAVWKEFFANIDKEPENMTSFGVREGLEQDLIIVDNIEYHSLCSHHAFPFSGVAHVAYLPHKKIIGLSKIPRVVRHFSKQPQVQEELVIEITDFLNKILEPQFLYVTLRGRHECTSSRGVESKCNMRCAAMRWNADLISEPDSLKHEVLELLKLA